MREIKFRAWDKLGDDDGNPCMRPWESIIKDRYSRQANSIFNDPMLILMQYTGLKDCKGIEIYEFSQINNRYEVIYIPPKYILKDMSNGDMFDIQEIIKNENGLEVTKEYSRI